MTNWVTPRLAVAERVAARWVDQGADAVLCSGSTSRNQADRWSDLEITVVWRNAPSRVARDVVRRQVGGSDPRWWDRDAENPDAFDEWWYDGRAGDGLLVETTHVLRSDASDRLDGLLSSAVVTSDALAFASALADGIVLAGDADELCSRVAHYPGTLAEAVVRRLGQIDNFWRWQMYVERGATIALREQFGAAVTAVAHMLFAINRLWAPGAKWLERTVSSVRIAPSAVGERIQAIDRESPERAAATLTDLVLETHQLVAEHLPNVDVARMREIFQFSRVPWPRGDVPTQRT